MPNNEDIKKQIKYDDIMFYFIIINYILLHTFTLFTFAREAEITQTNIVQVATVLETNPLVTLAYKLNHLGYVLSFLIMPAMISALYYYYRRKVLKGKVDVDSFHFFVLFSFFMSFYNIINDVSNLIGRLL